MTIPVIANVNKVKRRRRQEQQGNNVNVNVNVNVEQQQQQHQHQQDLMLSNNNQSYVFDYQEDQRARAAEALPYLESSASSSAEAAVATRASPRRGKSSNKHQHSTSTSTSPRTSTTRTPTRSISKSARQKKRQLETRFGSSAPSSLVALHHHNHQNQNQNHQSPSSSSSPRGGRRHRSFIIAGHHSAPSIVIPPLLLFHDLHGDDNKHNNTTTNNHNSSKHNDRTISNDNSLVMNDLENQLPPPRRIPSKASQNNNNNKNTNTNTNSQHPHHASLNGYLTNNNNNNNRNKNPKRKIKMRDTNRLLVINHPRRHHSVGGRLERQDHSFSSSSYCNTSSTSQSPQQPQQPQPQRGRSPSKRGGRSLEQQQGGRGRRSLSSSASSSSFNKSNHHHHHLSTTKQGGRRARSMSADNTISRGRSTNNTNTLPGRGLSKKQQRSQSSLPSFSMSNNATTTSISSSSNNNNNNNSNIMVSQPTVIQHGDKTVLLVPVTQEQAMQMPKVPTIARNGDRIPFLHPSSSYYSYFPRKIIPPMEEKPPRSLVLIWVVVSAELAFDLATTIIAFMSLVEDDTCCGEQIELGPIPMTVTAPFFLLVLAELSFLFRAMILTMWPSLFTGEVTEEDQAIRAARGFWKKFFCCWLRWKAKLVLKILNFLVLLNPFFGCVIAWMLLYQSNKVESFVVLGLEGGSILLHFFSVYLEGSCSTRGQFLCHCVPLLPFFASVTLILLYLKQGGVCYLVDSELFVFSGCEICADGFPPVNNQCVINGTNVTIVGGSDGIFDFNGVERFSDVGGALTQRADQGMYCGNLQDEGPNVSFCFFEYNTNSSKKN